MGVRLALTITACGILFLIIVTLITLCAVYLPKIRKIKPLQFDNDEHEKKKTEKRIRQENGDVE